MRSKLSKEERLYRRKEYLRRYRLAHLDIIREQQRRYAERRRRTSPDLVRARNTASRKRHPETQRAWVAANRERMRKLNRESVARNRDKVLARQRDFYARNREDRMRYQREHYAANKDQYLKNVRIRRARKHNAGGAFTESDVRRQYVIQSGCCFWCDAKLEAFHRDHLIPLAKGGTNGAENLVLACKDCNLSKGSSMPFDFARRRRELNHEVVGASWIMGHGASAM